MNNRIYKRLLLGLGFDCDDGHIRITKGQNFRLFGGSKKTHELMQEKAIKLNECLNKKKKSLDQIKPKEFYEIAEKIGLHVPKELRDEHEKGGK